MVAAIVAAGINSRGLTLDGLGVVVLLLSSAVNIAFEWAPVFSHPPYCTKFRQAPNQPHLKWHCSKSSKHRTKRQLCLVESLCRCSSIVFHLHDDTSVRSRTRWPTFIQAVPRAFYAVHSRPITIDEVLQLKGRSREVETKFAAALVLV